MKAVFSKLTEFSVHLSFILPISKVNRLLSPQGVVFLLNVELYPADPSAVVSVISQKSESTKF